MRVITRTLVVSSLILQVSCATVTSHQTKNSIHDLMRAGQFAQAAARAEQIDTAEEDVLPSLNKGILRRINGDFNGSNRIFEKAKKKIEELYGISITEQVGAFAVNDTLRAFKGDRYEQVLLHAYMALNYIEQGQPDAARVEMLQADVKMREWGEQPEEDPFVRYLSGMIYEKLGEPDEAVIAYRKAKQVYQETTDKQPTGVPAHLRKDLLRLLKREGRTSEYNQLSAEFGMQVDQPPSNEGDVVVVLNMGSAPRRSENALQTFSTEISHIVRIALPTYKEGKRPLHQAVLRTYRDETSFETVEDVDALARDALESDMAGITARAIARAVVKHKTSQTAEEHGGAIMGLLMKATNLATERADTRSWWTLPSEIQLVRTSLPHGKHTLYIAIRDAAGRTIDNITKTVTVKPGKTSILSAHWLAPRAHTGNVASR